MASRLFDTETRERAWLLYAWCRRCDDIIDGQELGHGMQAVADPAARLAEITRLTEAAMRGEVSGHPAFDALGIVAAETGLPPAYPRELIAGMALDAAGFAPASEDDLLRYCWHVAGVVGVMMAIVMGASPADRATLIRASDLGLSFQLNNIARDLVEDAGVGRCYVPASWLAEAGLGPDDYADPANRGALAAIAGRLAGMAELYEASALYGTPALSRRSAAAVIAAAGIYGDIGRKVRALGPSAWDGRVSTSTASKLWWAVKAQGLSAARHRLWGVPAVREGLWTPQAL